METPIRSSQFLLPNHVETSRRTSAHLPSGKLPHNYGKIHHFQWLNPLHISMVMFNSYVSHYQRVFPPLLWWLSAVQGLLPLLSPLAGADGAVVTWESFLKIRHIWQLWLETQKKRCKYSSLLMVTWWFWHVFNKHLICIIKFILNHSITLNGCSSPLVFGVVSP